MAGIDTGSSYLSMLGQTNSLSSSSAKKLQNTLSNTDKSTSTDDEMMDVCKDFESYFVQKIYEEMKKRFIAKMMKVNICSILVICIHRLLQKMLRTVEHWDLPSSCMNR